MLHKAAPGRKVDASNKHQFDHDLHYRRIARFYLIYISHPRYDLPLPDHYDKLGLCLSNIAQLFKLHPFKHYIHLCSINTFFM